MEFRNLLNFILSLFILYVFLLTVPFLYGIFVTFCVCIVGINLAEWLMSMTRIHFLHKKVDPKNKAVLITGCSSGFGKKLARRMDQQGYKVFAACRNVDCDGAKELMNCSKNLSIVCMDVINNQSIEEAKEFISKNLHENVLWAVVNNAGNTHAGEIDWTPFETFQEVHDVNAAGILRVTKAFLPFIKRSKGRIVNHASISGRIAFPGLIGYAMAKRSAIALTSGLCMELKKWGVKVISVEPALYNSPMTQVNAVCDLAERTWKKAPAEIREDYGEHYFENFKKTIANFLSWCNPNVSEVTDCLEDAITAEEPLSVYSPCSFWFKVVTKLLIALPQCISDGYQRHALERGVKPTALMHKENKN